MLELVTWTCTTRLQAGDVCHVAHLLSICRANREHTDVLDSHVPQDTAH